MSENILEFSRTEPENMPAVRNVNFTTLEALPQERRMRIARRLLYSGRIGAQDYVRLLHQKEPCPNCGKLH